MKDEGKGILIDRLVEFEPKMGSLVILNGKVIKGAKRVNKRDAEVSTNIRHKKYVDVLFCKKIIRYSMKRIQSKLHRIGINNIYKFPLL